MTYTNAHSKLPGDAAISSSFGYPGEGGYNEFWRTADGSRWVIANGSYLDCAPFSWTCKYLDRVTVTR